MTRASQQINKVAVICFFWKNTDLRKNKRNNEKNEELRFSWKNAKMSQYPRKMMDVQKGRHALIRKKTRRSIRIDVNGLFPWESINYLALGDIRACTCAFVKRPLDHISKSSTWSAGLWTIMWIQPKRKDVSRVAKTINVRELGALSWRSNMSRHRRGNLRHD